MDRPIIYACSDSLGETAERVARAAASQYDKQEFNIVRLPYIRSEQQIEEIVQKATDENAMICYTIISPVLRKRLSTLAQSAHIPVIDIIGPMMNGIGHLTDTEPTIKAGMIHRLDGEYFKRVDAIEFAVKFDDGKNPLGVFKVHTDFFCCPIQSMSQRQIVRSIRRCPNQRNRSHRYTLINNWNTEFC